MKRELTLFVLLLSITTQAFASGVHYMQSPEDLIAGEDPELSYRIRQSGWQILRIDAQMTTHDINMSTFRQYLKRAYRSGHAYAEIALRFLRNEEKLWLKELTRIVVKAVSRERSESSEVFETFVDIVHAGLVDVPQTDQHGCVGIGGSQGGIVHS